MGEQSILKYHHFNRYFTYSVKQNGTYVPFLVERAGHDRPDLCRRQIQMGSLAGAAHLLQDNTGVLRRAQKGQKPFVE